MNEPMETLQRAGWRMRTPLCFVRRGECLWIAADGRWRWLTRRGHVWRLCKSLRDSVEYLPKVPHRLAVVAAVEGAR